MPPALTAVQAAAIPETVFTVWHNVFERGRLQNGETLLVHGGSSGIGTTAIQLAKAFGARVLATAGSDEKCEACRRLGADACINYKTQDFVVETKGVTAGKGADVIMDMVGGDYIERNYEAAAVEGRVVQIAVQAGAKSTIDLTNLQFYTSSSGGAWRNARYFLSRATMSAASREPGMGSSAIGIIW